MPRLSKILLIVAAVPLALLAGWTRVIEPALVKIPGDVNRTNNYSGTVSVFVDAKTATDLPAPQDSPMTIVRVTQSVSGETGATTTALQETDNINLLGQTSVQNNVFVLDRSSARNVFDDRATAYGSSVNRHGAYFPNLPFGVDSSRRYPIWNNEAGAIYVMQRAGGAETATINGLKVLRMSGTLPITPVASYYTSELTKLGLPAQLTPEQLQAQFASSGASINQVADALGKVLSPDEMLTVIGALANPLPLKYYTALTGDARIEPTTGIVVWTHSVKRFFVGPDPASLAPVKKALDNHVSDPVVKAVDDYLTTLSQPRAAFTLDYTTNPASAKSMASYAKDQRAKLRLAQLYAPAGLLLVTVLLCFGAWVPWRRRQQPPAPPAERDVVDIRFATANEREPAGV
jgi:Porin PorA